MMGVYFLMLVAFALGVGSSPHVAPSSPCLQDAPFKLSPYDGLLGVRLKIKEVLVRNGSRKEEFVYKMDNFTSNGTEYTSKGTSDWLSEIVQGLSGSFDEEKGLLSSSSAAGYVDITNNLQEFFRNNAATNRHLYFKMRMRGMFEHDWLIEQLENGYGHRVYQSIGNAYSLKAWLTTDQMDFRSDWLWMNGHIKYWQKNYDRVENKLKKVQLTMMDIPSAPKYMQPWLTFIRDYNRTLITHNLRRAWVNYGSGRNIPLDTFQREYLGRMHNITTQIKEVYLKHPRTEWSQRMDDMWIELFGSPNIYCFPALSFDTDTLFFPQHIRIEAKTLEGIPEREAEKNVEILADSVQHDKMDLGHCSKAHSTQLNLSMLLFGMMTFTLLLW